MLLFFHAMIVGASLTTIPRSTGPYTAKCVPWWNSNYFKDHRIKLAPWKSFRPKRHTQTKPDPLFALTMLLHSFAALYVKSNTSWKIYLSSITEDTSVNAILSHMRRVTGKLIPPRAPVLSLDCRSVADSFLVADDLGEYFSLISRGPHLSPEFHNLKRNSQSHPISFIFSSKRALNSPFFFSLSPRSYLLVCTPIMQIHKQENYLTVFIIKFSNIFLHKPHNFLSTMKSGQKASFPTVCVLL